jgi:MFS family permease
MSGPSRGSVSAFTIAGIAVASALVPLNSTMIAVALPRLADEFGISTGRVGILITVYLAAMLVGQPAAGRIGDVVGVRRLAVIAVTGFGVCSAAALFAGSFPVLVALRGGQAAFASALSPSVQAILRLVTAPAERGRAFGVQGSVIGVGAGLGPVIGGVLIALFGWRAIFGVNVPLVVVVLIVLRRSVPVDRVPSTAARSQPAEPPERLVNRVFASAFSTQALTTLAQYTLLLVTPIVLDERGWGSGQIGLALSLLTVGMVVMSPAGGRLGDRFGRRSPVMAGIGVATVAVAGSAVFGDHGASALLLATLLLFGLGLGAATPSIISAGMEAAPLSRLGLGSGLLSTSRYVGSIVASVALTAVVADDGRGVGLMLLFSIAGLLLALVAATRLPSARSVTADAVL